MLASEPVTTSLPSDPVTTSKISLYQQYRALAKMHGCCLSLELSDIINYPLAEINAKVIIVGDPGLGKSTTAVGLAEGISFWNSLRTYGDTKPEHMKEFFGCVQGKDIAIMDKTEIKEVMRKATTPYHVYIADDVGSAWNARQWHKMQNQVMNSLVGTDRTFRTVKILTLSSDKELDSQARNKFTHYIEMTGPMLYEEGVVFAKLFRTRGKPRQGKVHYNYPRGREQDTNIKIIYEDMACLYPSQFYADIYKPIRHTTATAFNDKQFKELDAFEKAIEAKKNGDTQKHTVKQDIIDYYDDHPGAKAKEIRKVLGYSCTESYINQVIACLK
ncbi:hypothetical protein [Methanocella sp. MCL-LM]|uniref:hypothetical protein n=1 Tax=Methanocella sp. MCL-LM TaxID=3412035 RepID=UPI003C781D0A